MDRYKVPIKSTDLPIINSSSLSPKKFKVTDLSYRTIKLIKKVYKLDFELFGYSTEIYAQKNHIMVFNFINVFFFSSYLSAFYIYIILYYKTSFKTHYIIFKYNIIFIFIIIFINYYNLNNHIKRIE